MTNMTVARCIEKPRLSLRAQALATLAAIVGAVAVPQLFHVLGAIAGLGTGLGEIFLPMHLPIILVGLLAGPYAGLVAGACGPLVSFALSAMPSAVMLPFMMIELACYGLVAGLLRNTQFPAIGKVLAAQVIGRLVRAVAILLSVYAFGNEAIRVATIWNSIVIGLPGLILQWALLPLIVFWVESRQSHE